MVIIKLVRHILIIHPLGASLSPNLLIIQVAQLSELIEVKEVITPYGRSGS